MDLHIAFNEDQLAKLSKIPFLVQTTVADKCLTAMAVPIVAKARSIAPSSRVANPSNATQGPTRNKWGKNKGTKSRFDPAVWSRDDSGKHISKKVFRAQNGGIVFVGFQHPFGNKAQFNSLKRKKVRDAKFWGNPGRAYRPRYIVMQRAYDETKSEQLAAFERTFEREVRNLNLG